MPTQVTVEREFIGLPSPTAGRGGAGGHPCQGLYHRATGTKPKVAFIATHYQIDFSEHYIAEYLARHGYGFLGWNTRFRGLKVSSYWITPWSTSVWACAGYKSRQEWKRYYCWAIPAVVH